MIERRIAEFVSSALDACRREGLLAAEGEIPFEITTPRDEGHGDFTTNAALVAAPRAGLAPRKAAQLIAAHLPESCREIASAEVAGPGFINFRVQPRFYLEALAEIEEQGERFGELEAFRGHKLQVEFVSANPTGPLHIGHGRGAVYGDVLANIFRALGAQVTKEYYVNDAGGQIRTLGRSVWLRWRELEGEEVEFPPEAYQGHYIVEIARAARTAHSAKLGGMGEEEAIAFLGTFAGDRILAEIQQDLAQTGVVHDTYFFESRLHTDAAIGNAIVKLREHGHLYDQDGALWFRSTAFGDDKDRVLCKGDGSLTYFAADVAYHKNKYERGFDRVIDVWGADHGGYVARMKAAVEALGFGEKKFDAVLIQLVNLVRGGEVVSMSTRQATYETLEEVRREVGRDVCRYFFLMRSHHAQLDFDLELAKRHSSDNPVYYIQYAHARIASIFRKALEQGFPIPQKAEAELRWLDLPEEARLARMLVQFPRILESCTEELEPHKLAFYLLELCRMFQSYYSRGRADERYRVLSGEKPRVVAKLFLLKNIQVVLQNALRILGISAPERMEREGQEEDDV